MPGCRPLSTVLLWAALPAHPHSLCPPPTPPPFMQLIGMTCPVKQGKALCDMVVAQNFTPSDVVFAVVELLAAWRPAA